MLDCPICYLEFNELKLISPGCCSIKLCRECVTKCDNCPQCKQVFCWTKPKDIIPHWVLMGKIALLSLDLELAKEDILQLSKSIKEKQKIILDKEMRINTLMNNTSIVNEKNEFDSVVLRYHLNIQ